MVNGILRANVVPAVRGGIAAMFLLISTATAIELTEPEGAAHGYPGLCDIEWEKTCRWGIQAVDAG